VELLSKTERRWTKRGHVINIPTLGYNKRINCFITLFWPKKSIVWNLFARRRNIEFRKHLSNLVAYAKRQSLKRIILFVDYASYHDTPQVRKFIVNHKVLRIKWLGKKDPNSNPVELHVNKRLTSAVNINRPNEDLPRLKQRTKKFLKYYNSKYAT